MCLCWRRRSLDRESRRRRGWLERDPAALVGGGALPRRIVVALDGSARAERVLPLVEELATRARARVTLVRAWPRRPAADPSSAVVARLGGALAAPSDRIELKLRREAWRYLEETAERLRGRGVAADYELVEGPAGETIVDEAEALGAELVAMTTHGRSGLGRLAVGSVADYVMRHSSCPVLLARAA